MQKASNSNYGVHGVAAVSILGPSGVMRDARCAIQAQARHDNHAWLLVRIAPGYLVMHRWESPLPQITLQLLLKFIKKARF